MGLKYIFESYRAHRDQQEVRQLRAELARYKDLDALANKLMGWPVPVGVVSDRCMSEPNYKFPRHGTCIMGPGEARQMLEFLFTPQQ